ncbi:MAG: ABC transporter substrate-binding protein [Deltaproteobacteria bacterium]|nr:ABC transporter substrate-binding protein [Deltaproteobacteria bacterium]
MDKIRKGIFNTAVLLALSLAIAPVIFGGCEQSSKIFTIGIISYAPLDSPIMTGFKDGMTESGYIDGKDIRYIYKGLVDRDEHKIDAAIREILSLDIDLILTAETNVSVRAKELTKGTGIPVLFGGDPAPVENGLVKSINKPGSNMTGIRALETTQKALEWMMIIIPGAKKVYLPYKPDDPASIMVLPELEIIAPQMGVELVRETISSVEEAVAGIERLQPGDADAVFLIPSLTLNSRSSELIQACIKRGIPVFSSMQLDESILFTLINDFHDAGRKAARLAGEINKGVRVEDLPVETSELQLIINLKTAERIGISIPDDVLLRADTIIPHGGAGN